MTTQTALHNLRKTIDNDAQRCPNDTAGINMIKGDSESVDMDTEILNWLYWVALKIKADIRESPSHDIIGGIDQRHAEAIVPDSLYLLL